MKKFYIAPKALVLALQEENLIALSIVEGGADGSTPLSNELIDTEVWETEEE